MREKSHQVLKKLDIRNDDDERKMKMKIDGLKKRKKKVVPPNKKIIKRIKHKNTNKKWKKGRRKL